MLANPAIELAWERRVGFALDAALALEFLHGLTPQRLHRYVPCIAMHGPHRKAPTRPQSSRKYHIIPAVWSRFG